MSTQRLSVIAKSLALGLTVVLAACSGSPPSSSSPAPVSPTQGSIAPSAAPATGGTVTIVDLAEPPSISPILQTSKHIQRNYLAIMEPFVWVDKDNRAITKEGLATDWEQRDELTWRFKIREGVQFSNGEPLDADAVAFTFEQARHGEGSRLASFLGPLSEAVKVDDHTIDIKTSFPDAAAPARLNMMLVLPPKYYAEVGAEAFGQAPIGTGPFVFESWAPGQQITLKRNDGYWGTPALIDTIVWKWAPEAATRVALLESGGADLIPEIPPALKDTITTGSVSDILSQGSIFVSMNTFLAPTDDLRIRKAVTQAIDRDSIVQNIFGGAYESWAHIFPPGWASTTDHADQLGFDLDAAKALVQEYTAEKGAPTVDLNWAIGGFTSSEEVGEAVAGMLEAAGFKVNRKPTDNGTLAGVLGSKNDKGEGQLPGLYIGVFNVRFPHEDIYMRSRFVSNAFATYCHLDPELDARVNAAAGVTDEAQRATTYNELEDYFVNERVCWDNLYYVRDYWGTSPRLQGFQPRSDQLVDWPNLSVVD